MQTKKRHHYVWQYYLQPWLNEDKKIFCLFKNQKKIVTPSTSSIAVSKYFYRSHELTSDDIKYIRSIIDSASSEVLREINSTWLNKILSFYELNKQMKSLFSNDLEGRQLLEKTFEGQEKMLYEELHTNIESSAHKFLEEIRNNGTLNLNDIEMPSFIFYLVSQFMRTRRQKEFYLNIIREEEKKIKKFFPDFCPERTYNIMSIIFSTNIGHSLNREIENYSFDIICNETEVPFITGDQPVINLGDHNQNNLWMYYPISPDSCFVLQPRKLKKYTELSSEDVLILNKQIYDHSLEQVYAKNEFELKRYL